jgi:chromosome segregation ATPase
MSTIVAITDSTTPPPVTSSAQPSKLSQLEQLLKQGRVHLQDLRSRLEQATKERDQLAAELKARDASHEQLWADQAELQRADAERHARELAGLRAELSEAIVARDAAYARRDELELKLKDAAALRAELDETIAARDRLEDQLREADEQRVSLEKTLATALNEVEQLRADADRAAALAREIFEIHQK